MAFGGSNLVTSISTSSPELVAENLFNFRDGVLMGISPRLRWPESVLNSVVRDGVAVRAYPDKYCSESPCLSLFIESDQDSYFPELEGAYVRLYALPPRIGKDHGVMRCVHRGSPIAEGVLRQGKVEFNVPLFNVVYVQVTRQNLSFQSSTGPIMSVAG